MPDHSVHGDMAPPHGPPISGPDSGVRVAAGAPDAGAEPGTSEDARPAVAELERVRARDPEALAAFFERYFDRVYGLVYRLLGDRTLAEDMTQDVFLKVHRAAHQLDPSRDPGPWLMTIAHNACRDLWRSNAWKLTRRAASLDEETPLASTLSRGTNDPERDLLASERERLVQEALAKLPDPLRVAIVMHDYQGMSHDKIATATGIHHAAARKLYSRALAALARLLKDSLG